MYNGRSWIQSQFHEYNKLKKKNNIRIRMLTFALVYNRNDARTYIKKIVDISEYGNHVCVCAFSRTSPLSICSHRFFLFIMYVSFLSITFEF